jgi:hypothetical protein
MPAWLLLYQRWARGVLRVSRVVLSGRVHLQNRVGLSTGFHVPRWNGGAVPGRDLLSRRCDGCYAVRGASRLILPRGIVDLRRVALPLRVLLQRRRRRRDDLPTRHILRHRGAAVAALYRGNELLLPRGVLDGRRGRVSTLGLLWRWARRARHVSGMARVLLWGAWPEHTVPHRLLLSGWRDSSVTMPLERGYILPCRRNQRRGRGHPLPTWLVLCRVFSTAHTVHGPAWVLV